MKKKYGILLVVLMIFTIKVVIFAGTRDFAISLPWWNEEVNATSYQRKTTNTDGSSVKFNTAATGGGQCYAYTRLIFNNSGNTVKYSPKVLLSTTSGTYQWLGAYVEYDASVNDQIQLVLSSPIWNGDNAAGTWDYK